MESDFLHYLNLARTTPAHFIPLIDSQLSAFTSNQHIPLTSDIVYQSNDGKSAWIEAKDFLAKQQSISPFFEHPGLCRAADDHLKDICLHNNIDHQGSDGSTLKDRVLRYCIKKPGAMAEMIGLEFDLFGRNTAELTILGLIIDDGVKDRGHRQMIFNPQYKYVGWATGKQEERLITVFNLLENNLKEKVRSKQQIAETGNQSQQLAETGNQSQQLAETGNQSQQFVRVIGSWEEVPLEEIMNENETRSTLTTTKKNRKLFEKLETKRIFYDNGTKVVQNGTKMIFNDGSVEEMVQRSTIYDQQ